MNIMIGTSGFSYEDWRGFFYPPDLPKKEMLPYYAEHFPTVEVNATYYSMPSPATLAQMARKVPTGFQFVVKAHKEMTHAEEFLPELADCSCKQISIETAQSKLDCAVLRELPGKQILLGTIDLSDMNVESPETVAARIRRALPYTAPENILVSTDCGMKYLPRDVADGKLRALVAGAKIVRAEIGGSASSGR